MKHFLCQMVFDSEMAETVANLEFRERVEPWKTLVAWKRENEEEAYPPFFLTDEEEEDLGSGGGPH